MSTNIVAGENLGSMAVGEAWLLAGEGVELWRLAIGVVVSVQEGRRMCDIGRQIDNDRLRSR